MNDKVFHMLHRLSFGGMEIFVWIALPFLIACKFNKTKDRNQEKKKKKKKKKKEKYNKRPKGPHIVHLSTMCHLFGGLARVAIFFFSIIPKNTNLVEDVEI